MLIFGLGCNQQSIVPELSQLKELINTSSVRIVNTDEVKGVFVNPNLVINTMMGPDEYLARPVSALLQGQKWIIADRRQVI